MKPVLISSLLIISSLFAQAAVEVIPLWPGTPPGARKGDDALAVATAEAIRDGSYIIPDSNRKGTQIPTIEVYLPEKEKQNGTALVIYSGGGYAAVCIKSEGMPVAKYLNDKGISVFMVSYRCKPYRHPVPFWDSQRAIRLVRHHAEKYNIDPSKIGVMGFSAGGHVAANISVNYKESFGRTDFDDIDKENPRPDFSCLIYPVISMNEEVTHRGSRVNLVGKSPDQELITKLSTDEQVNPETPPSFLTHAKSDTVVKVLNSELYHNASLKHGVSSELLLFEKGRHGPGFFDGKPSIAETEAGYIDNMVEWIHQLLGNE